MRKWDFKVKFTLINETLNLKRLFTFKERLNQLHRSSVVYRITKNVYWLELQEFDTPHKNRDPTSPTIQDTDVSKHLTVMAKTNHWRKLLITET